MKIMLGEECIERIGAPDLPEFRLFDCFTSATHESVKDGVLKAYTQPASPLRIVGIDTLDIRCVVHRGPPHDVEQYVQATGRAGRDGNMSYAVLLYIQQGIKTSCRRNNAELQ